LEGADFSSADLKQATFNGARFDSTVFDYADLEDAGFANCNVWDARFDRAQNLPEYVRQLLAW
ncbi:MAG: pentapeptide repeat-containing protein, partial [Gammaproteobacteria bacterium]